MDNAFSDLIPQKGGDANNAFGDLIPAAQPDVPKAAVVQPGKYGDQSSVAVFSDEAAPKTIPDDVLAAYNQFSRTAKSADDLIAYGKTHGLEVPLKEAQQFIVDRAKAGGQVGEGVNAIAPQAQPIALDPADQAEQADIAHSDGMFDRLGDLWSRGADQLGAGTYALSAALHDFNNIQLPWQSDEDYLANLGGSKLTQMDLRQKAAVDATLGATPIQGEQGFDDISSVGDLGRFALEQGVGSLPGMAAAIVNPGAYVYSNTGSIAQQRAANDGREAANLGDAAIAAPAGIISGALERAGIESIFNPHAGNLAVKVGKAAAGEGATEVAQTGDEYLGGNLGTDAGINAKDMLTQMEAAGVAGAAMGGAAHPVVMGAEAAPRVAEKAQGLPAYVASLGMQVPDSYGAPEANPTQASEPMLPLEAPKTFVPQDHGNAFADLVPAAPEAKPAEPQPAAAAPEPAPIQTAQPAAPQSLQDGERHVRTPAGTKVRTKLEVVDASTLNKAQGDLQNRDRSRDTTALQVQDIVGKFDPELLGDDPSSDRGAPIVAPDHTVLSGNGRMLALNAIYDQHPDKAAAYRQMIEAHGLSTGGMDRPVLIRRVAQDMTPEEQRQFVIESNKDNKLELSPVERARSDADAVTPEMLAKFKGGDLNSAQNSDFIGAFTKSLTAGELGNFIGSDRRLTTAGVERVENAVVAKAYDHPKLLEKLMESTHNEIRAITSSLANVAPAWAKMRASAKAGDIGSHYDITNDLADAAMRVAEARRAGTKPADILTQADAFDRPSPVAEKLIEAFYTPGMKKAQSPTKVTQFLRDYLDEVNAQTTGTDIFGETSDGVAPADILSNLLRQREGGDSLFDRSNGNAHPQGLPRPSSAALDERANAAQVDDPSPRLGDAPGHDGGRSAASSATAGGARAPAADGSAAFPGQPNRATTRDEGRHSDGAAASSHHDLAADGRPLSTSDSPVRENGNGSLTERSSANDGADRAASSGGAGRNGQPDRSPGGDAELHSSEPRDASGVSGRNVGLADRAANGHDGSGGHASVASGAPTASGLPGSEATQDARGSTGDGSGRGRGDTATDTAAGRDASNRSDQLLDEEAPYGPQGAYKPSFEAASFTDRASIYGAAAEAVGLDADRLRLLPAPRQVALLQRAMFQSFGIRVNVDKGMQERWAIDQMLDAFQNAQGMAHVLTLPARSISLDGKLSLKLVKNAGFLGSYSPGAEEITLPKRSNSFAHEWGHALDYHLLHLTDGDGRGLSGSARAEGLKADSELPTDVRSAFVDLLNAMFFDKAAAAERIMQLEKKIAATKGVKTKAQLIAQLERMKDGSSKARGIETAFHKNAKGFDAPGSEYWSSPTEMFARAFEAYVSNQAEAAGLGTEFIGKGDANYLDGAGERFAKTFPKGEERQDIFAAFDKLLEAVGQSELTANGEAAERPNGPVSKITDLDRLPKAKREANIVKREVLEIRHELMQLRKEKEGRGKDPKTAGEWLADANGALMMSMTGAMRMIQRRSGSPSLQKMIDLLTKQDGKGDRTVGRTFHEDVAIRSHRARNRLSNILKANDLLKGRTKEDDRLLRDLLIGAHAGPAAENFVKAAAAIRQLLDHEWYENQKVGIDLGYTRNGYLQRVLDMPLVWNDPEGFVRDAGEVYKVVFDNAFHNPESVAASDELLPRFMRMAGALAKKGYDVDPAPVRAILKQINRINDAIDRLKSKGEDAGSLEGKIEKLSEELGEALGELWDQVRPAFANERAQAWLSKVNLVAGEEHNAAAPDSKYTKHRALPPEADKLMENFYTQDPVEAVTNYLNQSARRTAYAQRFGHDGAKRKALFEAMAREGVSPADQRTVQGMLDIATGRRRSELNAGFQKFLGWVNALGTMALLPRAWISSLAEPFTSAIVTGDAMSGFKMVGMQLGQALNSPSAQWRHELSRAMGIVADIGADGIMEARYGQTYGDTTRADRAVATMFKRTLLTPLTRSQKIAGVGLGHAFLDNLAGQIAGGKGEHAIALMRELGIRDPEAFSKQLLQIGRPQIEDLDSEWGEDYSTAQLRFSDMVIQNPSAMDRPELSQNPVGRILYSITGFSYGYWRNVVKRTDQLLRQIRDIDGAGAMFAHLAKVVAGAALAYLIGTTVSTIREYLLNRRRWEDLKDKGQLESTMAQLGFTRVFSFGAADPAIQAYSGLKYQRDLGTALLGAKTGYFANAAAQPIIMTSSNSRKTNSAEYNAMKGVTQMVAPIAAYGLSTVPGGLGVDLITGAAISYLTAPAFQDDVARATVGPKNGSKGPDGEKVKSGPTAYDKMLNATLGEMPDKKKEE